MAIQRQTARAQAIAQLETVTIGGTIAVNDDFSATINKKTVTFKATATTIANVTAGLSAALAASSIAEFSEVTWSNASPTVTGIGAADVPFEITVSKVSASGTIATVTTTAATGPTDWNNADNWDTGSVPVNSDDAFLDGTSSPIRHGLDQSAVTLSSLTIGASFEGAGTIGLPETNPLGYVEYRDLDLQIGATNVTIGSGSGQGSGRIRIDLGSVASTVRVMRSSSPLDVNSPSIVLKGTAITEIEVNNGSCGISVNGVTADDVTTVRVGDSGRFSAGENAVVQDVVSSGDTTLECDLTSLTMNDGESVVRGSAAVTTATVNGGNLHYRSSGAITTLVTASTVDFSGDVSPRTVTNATIKPGGRLIDPHGTVTHTNGISIASDVSEVTAA